MLTWTDLISNFAVLLFGGGGAFAWWRSRKRENVEVSGLEVAQRVDELQRLQERVKALDAKEDEHRAELSKAYNELHLAQLHNLERDAEMEQMKLQMLDMMRRLTRAEVTVEVLSERLQRHDDAPNGWTSVEVDRRIAERRSGGK